MSIFAEYDNTRESEDFKCPYCGEEYGDGWEIAEADDLVEIECDNCGRKYWGDLQILSTYVGKPDCKLNGEEHKFEDINLEDGRSFHRCKVCGEIELKGEKEK